MVSERPLADYRYRCLPSYLFILDYVTTYYITIDVFVRALQNSLKPWKANPFWWANQVALWETSGGHASFRMSRFSGKVAVECGKQDNNKRTGNPPCQKGEGLEIISWRIISTASRLTKHSSWWTCSSWIHEYKTSNGSPLVLMTFPWVKV